MIAQAPTLGMYRSRKNIICTGIKVSLAMRWPGGLGGAGFMLLHPRGPDGFYEVGGVKECHRGRVLSHIPIEFEVVPVT